MPRLRTLWICLLAGIAAPLPAQQFTWLRPGAAGTVDILSEPETGGPSTLLSAAVVPQGIEISGRTLQSPGQPAAPRIIDAHGIQRLELPDGGRVLRLLRPATGEHQLLHVAPGGAGRIVLTTPSPAPGVDPWGDRMGAATDGRHLLVPGAQTGLWIVRLDGANYPSSGGPARFVPTAPVKVEAPSCFVGPTHGFYHTDDGLVWRIPLADGGAPTDVTPAGLAGDEPKEEMAISGDGRWVVFLFGQNKQLRLFRLGTSGPAQALPFPPAAYEEPDYLPEGAGHPRILLNGDGSRLLFVDATIRDEWFLVDPAGQLPPIQFTDDSWFVPYIGVGIWPLFYGNRLVVAIGDPNRMDWFGVELGAGVTNLTGTGVVAPPFIEGTVDPTGALGYPGRGPVLTLGQTSTGIELRRVRPRFGTSSVIAADVQGILPPSTGRSEGRWITVQSPQGDRILDRTSGIVATALPPGARIGAPVHLAGIDAAVARVDFPGGLRLPVGYAPGTPLLVGSPEAGLAQVGISVGNRLILSGGNGLRLVGPTGVRVVSSDGGTRALSGLGV